ncbi:DUF6538 domain-containing protein [Afipia birgiae]|uniref:DUF6538 domain-containing protein n=1 Tax=Afipia birgiae TaxID=151414 RepID=UPI0003077A9D|nr:DUF6538 domain-containing protein [Afipia birgiae]
MVLLMARPWKHPQSGFYYIRQRIPQDVRAVARGLKIKLPEEAGNGGVELGPTTQLVKVSLRTRDIQDAKARHAAALSHLSSLWRSLRDGPQHLSQKQIIALAGDFRRRAVAKWDDEPGPSGIWSKLLEMSAKWDEATRLREMAPFVAEHLARHALNVSDDSKTRLAHELYKVGGEIAALMKRRAEGYYDVDDGADRFPPLRLPDTGKPPTAAKTLTQLFEGWKREAERENYAEKTFDEYEATIERLVAFLGHDDAVRVTPADVVAYKDMRLATINPRTGNPLSSKTVRDGDLAALKSVFSWAVGNHHLLSNPAEKITIKKGKPTQTRPKGYTDAEADKLLKAALAYAAKKRELAKTAAAKKWVPWLCAFTGARVGEIIQLRKEDVKKAGAHWAATITPEAGSVKGKEMRVVPLHPQLVELGFLDFVKASKGGYLFLTAEKRDEVRGRLNGVKNRVSEFVRSVVSDERIRPNHAWRHRFVTLSRRHDVDQELRRMILAQGGKGVDEEVYGEPEGLYREICKLPRYELGCEEKAA